MTPSERIVDLNARETILIVDDDRNVLEVLEARLSAAGFLVLKSSGADCALKILKKQPVDLMISDIMMPGKGGLELFTEARAIRPSLPVVFLTAYGTIPDAVQAVKAGAIDYMTKPFDGRDLVAKLQKALKPLPEKPAPVEIVPEASVFFWGKSPAMTEVYEMVEKVAGSNVNVLILGESGVGKELVARLIHLKSPRKDGPFVVVDCGSTPTGLLESELFGHVKGSFTNAIQDKKGLIEASDGGTLFLDEIGNISPEMQIRLLRFLEDRKIRRIGDLAGLPVDCRVISATNADIAGDIGAGKFRADLFYRIRVVTIRLPSLRDRKEDIPELVRTFVRVFCQKHGVPEVEIPQETLDLITSYSWPGNVRELRNAIEAGVVLCSGGSIRMEDLNLSSDWKNTIDAPPCENGFSLESNERDAIIRVLRQTGGVQKEAAKLLKISPRAIHYKIRKFRIDVTDLRGKSLPKPSPAS